MSPIEIVSTKSTQPHDDVAAEKPGANPGAEKKFGELMDRTLAKTGQKPPARETQAARKPAKKSQDHTVAKTADDDSDADTASDDKKTATATQPNTDPATVPPMLVLPLQILPIPVTVEVAKAVSAQAAAGDAQTPLVDGVASSSVSPADLQIASSRALFGLPTGNASTKSSSTGTLITGAVAKTPADAKALAALTAATGKAATQPDLDPDQLKPTKDGSAQVANVQVANGGDVPISPIPSNPNEKADGAGGSPPKNTLENSLLQSAEVAMATAGKGDEKPDLGKKANKNEVLTVQNAGGISAAQQDAQMKKVDKKNKIAGSGEKVLPETTATLDLGENLPATDKASVVPVSFDRIENTSLNTASTERPIEVASASVGNVAVASPVIDIRARAVERAGDILALQSMRLSDMSAESLKVTIRPGAGIELAVELHHGEKGIEATATLKNGDYHFLNSNWPDLQQRMEARGVRLSPLASSEQLPNNGNTSQFQQPRRQAGQQDDPAYAGAFADFVMAGSIAKQAVQGAVSRGFESWA